MYMTKGSSVCCVEWSALCYACQKSRGLRSWKRSPVLKACVYMFADGCLRKCIIVAKWKLVVSVFLFCNCVGRTSRLLCLSCTMNGSFVSIQIFYDLNIGFIIKIIIIIPPVFLIKLMLCLVQSHTVHSSLWLSVTNKSCRGRNIVIQLEKCLSKHAISDAAVWKCAWCSAVHSAPFIPKTRQYDSEECRGLWVTSLWSHP